MNEQIYSRQYFQGIYQNKMNHLVGMGYCEQAAKEQALKHTIQVYRKIKKLNKLWSEREKEYFRKYIEY